MKNRMSKQVSIRWAPRQLRQTLHTTTTTRQHAADAGAGVEDNTGDWLGTTPGVMGRTTTKSPRSPLRSKGPEQTTAKTGIGQLARTQCARKREMLARTLVRERRRRRAATRLSPRRCLGTFSPVARFVSARLRPSHLLSRDEHGHRARAATGTQVARCAAREEHLQRIANNSHTANLLSDPTFGPGQ